MLRLPALALAALLLLPVTPAAPAEPLGPGRVPSELVVGFLEGLPGDLDAWAAARGASVRLRDDVLAWAGLRFGSAAAADAALLRLKLDPSVRYVEHDTHIDALLAPNDPLWAQQWGPPAIQMPRAWDVSLGSSAVKLAILDTGVHLAHPDLAANLCGPFASFIPGEPTVDDQHGHGTHVSGIAAAAIGNGVGVAGVALACLMEGKVLGRSGSSQGTSVAAGIRWAADNGAHVVSMSLGRSDRLQATADAVAYAYREKGVLLVAAAGNSGCPPGAEQPFDTSVPPGQNRGSMLYPAFHDEVLAVAALAPPGTGTAGFSSCGPDMEIAAPGQSILATLAPCGVASLCSPSGYGSLSGTSMAAPHIGGLGALLKAFAPALGAVGLRCVLDLSADDLTPGPAGLPTRDARAGWGRANATRALGLGGAIVAAGQVSTFEAACAAGAPLIME